MSLNIILALIFLGLDAHAGAFSCSGPSAKTLPEHLHVQVENQTLAVSELNIIARRLVKNEPADIKVYVGAVMGNADSIVAIWSTPPYPRTTASLELAVPSPMGKLSKTYNCVPDVAAY